MNCKMRYNPNLSCKPDDYRLDNSQKTRGALLVDTLGDVMTILFTESSLKLWIRIWLIFLNFAVILPLAFLPHPFAIANLLGIPLILLIGGSEIQKIRGLSKGVGYVHFIVWIPLLIVNILSLTTDKMNLGSTMEYGKLLWENADGTYERARYVVLLYSTVMCGISLLFDAFDAIQYHVYDVKDIERSRWTIDQLVKTAEAEAKGGDTADKDTTTDNVDAEAGPEETA